MLVSTYCKPTEITDEKPNIILHYNKIKNIIDTFDQLCHVYIVTRKTNRWSMRYFLGMLDQAAVNVRILLKCLMVNLQRNEKVSTNCLQKLALHLIAFLRTRASNPNVLWSQSRNYSYFKYRSIDENKETRRRKIVFIYQAENFTKTRLKNESAMPFVPQADVR